MGGDQQAPPDKRKEEPMIAGRVEEIDHDQECIHRDIDEEMNEKGPLS